MLQNYVIMEALHDSGERFPEPACHPGTRTAILQELRGWSNDISKGKLLWLHGSAGVGKSAIAQMFAGDCESRGRLGASFFFKRGHSKRGTWHGIFSTIAYQLANSVPEFLLPLEQAMDSDKLAVGRSMTVQFQRLLVEPLRRMTGLRYMPVIVVDGLDECFDRKVQQQIVRLFVEALLCQQLPLRILIASRPEPYLREVFEKEQTIALCRQVQLSADLSAFDDIRTYLQDEFARINSEYRSRGVDLGIVWPSPEALQHLVSKSSGIFIYAVTVIRFIDDEYSHPMDRFEAVLRIDPQSTAPLDDLYTEILSVLPPEPQQLRILQAIWQGTLPHALQMSPEDIDVLLDLRRGTCRLALRGLHSVLYVPPIETRGGLRRHIRFLHASLPEYLGDVRRSGSWCILVPWLASDYLHCTIHLLSSPLTDSAWHFHR
ncbi:hypothetical protein DFH09DRAFT_919263 [Mycena vulgaris]|nr:hypothetical protein DFH09DRAFT_919263 [Mycena vulgaris]